MSNDTSRILIVHAGALGDTILLWPLLRSLSNVQFVTRRSFAELTQHYIPHVKCHNANTPEWTKLFSYELTDEDIRSLQNSTQHIDHLITFVSNPNDTWDTNAKQVWPTTCTQYHYLFTKPTSLDSDHLTQQWIATLASNDLNLSLTLPQVLHNNTGPILIHPGAGSTSKCWGYPQFETLITTLQHLNINLSNIQIILGEAEHHYAPDYCLSWAAKYTVIQPQSPLDLAQTIATSKLFIGNDSGPSHLAAAIGIPTLTLFGPTSPHIWQPIGPKIHTLYPDKPCPMNWLQPESVLETLQDLMHEKT